MSNQLTVRDDMSFDVILKDIETMQSMCATLLKTKHYQAMGEAGLFAIVQKAKTLNIHPLEALNGGLYFVQGKVGMGAETMNALIRQAGHSITKDAKSNETICILHGKRNDNGDTWSVSFSIEDARRAGLLKNMYDKYPAIMLYNRAMSMLARQLFPDVIKGAGYTAEELKEIKENTPASKVESIEEVKEEIISQSQIDQLTETFTACDPEYVGKVWSSLKKSAISSFEEIPCSLFDRLMTAANKNKTEYQAKLFESEKEGEVLAIGAS